MTPDPAFQIKNFISLLKDFSSPNVFNPWADMDPENDVGKDSPLIRCGQLAAYLGERIGKARYVLMGEAIGYQGGHFSGIPMTSERILLGHMADKGISAAAPFSSIKGRRTSRESVRPSGFTEPTATIVWGSLLPMGIDAKDFVIWNTFSWHPYNPAKGLLSNRRPDDGELSAGSEALRMFLSLFEEAEIIAVGKTAYGELKKMGLHPMEVRHPANGGAGKFREQIGRILSFGTR